MSLILKRYCQGSWLLSRIVFIVNAYPNWVYDQVYSSGFIADDPNNKISPVSARGEIEREILGKENLKMRQVDYLVRYYLIDENYEDAVLLLEEQNTIQASCALLPLLLETKDGQRLYALLQRIRDDADEDPGSSESTRLYIFCDYYELMFEIRSQPGGIEAITPTQLNNLLSFSELDDAMAVNNSNMLQYLELKEIEDLHLIGIDYGSIQKAPIMNEENQFLNTVPDNNDFMLYPNPATNEVQIRYDINDRSTQSYLVIYDLTGKTANIMNSFYV